MHGVIWCGWLICNIWKRPTTTRTPPCTQTIGEVPRIAVVVRIWANTDNEVCGIELVVVTIPSWFLHVFRYCVCYCRSTIDWMNLRIRVIHNSLTWMSIHLVLSVAYWHCLRACGWAHRHPIFLSSSIKNPKINSSNARWIHDQERQSADPPHATSAASGL